MAIAGDNLQFEVAFFDGNGDLVSVTITDQIIYDPSFTEISAISPAFTVNGAGVYTYTLSGTYTATPGRYRAQIFVAETDVTPQVAWDEFEVIAPDAISDPLNNLVPGSYATGTAGAKLGLLGTGGATYTAPVNPDAGTLTIIRGDDYIIDDGRQVPEWISDTWTPYDLSTATVNFKAKTKFDEVVFEKEMIVVSDTDVKLELTSAETSQFAVGSSSYKFDVEATIANNDIITLVQGTMTVLSDVR